jgi:hypothetical protein
LVYADDDNILYININTTENTEVLLDVGKEVGPKVNTNRMKWYVYILSPVCRTKSEFNDR